MNRREPYIRRDLWIRNTEIVLLLPATVIMAPMAAFAALGMVFAIVQQKFGFSAFWMMFVMLTALVAGIFGLVLLWASLVIPSQTFACSPITRMGVACGILVGIADAVYWLFTLRHELNSLGPSAWSMWLLMLGGPIAAGCHQILRLIWLRHPAKSQGSPDNW